MSTPTPEAVRAAKSAFEYFREFYPDPEELAILAGIIEREMSVWLPIEDAPKDGSEILVACHDVGVYMARWICAVDFMTESEMESMTLADSILPSWFYADFVRGGKMDIEPTHFRPIPQPPK